MGKRENTLLLLFGPTITIVGINFLSQDIVTGLVLILAAGFLTVTGSYYQWVDAKNRSRLWLIFPGLFTALGYLPLVLLREKTQIFVRLSRGAEFYKSPYSWDIFTFIAAKTAKYYLELNRNYRDRFNDEVTLLAGAGLLVALAYIEKTISPAQIIDIAKGSVPAKEEALVNFIINLETELLKIDMPEFDIAGIKEACLEKRRDIARVVDKVKMEYVRETDFALAASNLLEAHQFDRFREILGISEPEHHVLLS